MKITKLQIAVPGVYLLGALLVWIDFARMPPDGLANIGIALYTLPIMLTVEALTAREFPYVSSSLGYYQAHAVYFAVCVLIIMALLFLLVFGIQKRMKKA